MLLISGEFYGSVGFWLVWRILRKRSHTYLCEGINPVWNWNFSLTAPWTKKKLENFIKKFLRNPKFSTNFMNNQIISLHNENVPTLRRVWRNQKSQPMTSLFHYFLKTCSTLRRKKGCKEKPFNMEWKKIKCVNNGISPTSLHVQAHVHILNISLRVISQLTVTREAFFFSHRKDLSEKFFPLIV